MSEQMSERLAAERELLRREREPALWLVVVGLAIVLWRLLFRRR